MKPWERYQPDDTLYDGRRKVVRKFFRNDEGKTFDFETFERVGSASAGAIVIDVDGQVVIAEQFRVGPEKVMQDVPGGGIKPGQTPEEAARIEVLEETGYESDEWQYLGATHEHPYSNRNRHYFLATNARKVSEPQAEDLEDIRVKKISIDQLIINAKSGNMTDALIVLYAYDRLIDISKGN